MAEKTDSELGKKCAQTGVALTKARRYYRNGQYYRNKTAYRAHMKKLKDAQNSEG